MNDWQSDPQRRCWLSPASTTDFDTRMLWELLATHPLQAAAHGSTYPGRPATGIIATAAHFLKLHATPFADRESALAAIDQHRQRETALAIHPPGKQWFCLPVREADGQPGWRIGNRTPPLRICTACAPGEQRLAEILAVYFRSVREHGLEPDLSLANFGLDDRAGRVWYVDDDLYPWQDFHALHDFIAHLLRTGAVDPAEIDSLAHALKTGLPASWQPQALAALCDALAASVMPTDQAPLRQRLLDALAEPASVRAATSPGTPPSAERERQPDEQRLALLADVHGNLPALDAVLAFVAEQNVDRIVVLGDVVGYGPYPEACVQRLREYPDTLVIRGNHDNAVVTGAISGGTTSLANWSWTWSRRHLSTEAQAWLAALPCVHAEAGWLAVHGAPIDPDHFNAYVYRMSYEDNLDNLQERGIALCLHGHTHLQQLYCRQRGHDELWTGQEGSLAEVEHALLSPGSVGQPRCGTPGAELAILNWPSGRYRFHRLDYDIEQTLAEMRRQHFPSGLIERLQAGQ